MVKTFILTLAAAAALMAAPALAQVGSKGHGGVGDYAPPRGGVTFNPQDARNPISIAIAAFEKGDYVRASQMFDEALADAPEDPGLLTYQAMTYEGRRNFIGARQLLLHAIRVDRDNLDAHRELGLTYAALNNAKGVESELRWLRAKQASCPAKCDDPDKVKRSLDALEAVANSTAPKPG
jgi:tetratricopeptide (TPR) repeat protein